VTITSVETLPPLAPLTVTSIETAPPLPASTVVQTVVETLPPLAASTVTVIETAPPLAASTITETSTPLPAVVVTSTITTSAAASCPTGNVVVNGDFEQSLAGNWVALPAGEALVDRSNQAGEGGSTFGFRVRIASTNANLPQRVVQAVNVSRSYIRTHKKTAADTTRYS